MCPVLYASPNENSTEAEILIPFFSDSMKTDNE